MIVLHAALRDDALQVWGERPRRDDPAPGARSPYDAGAEALTSALRAAGLATPPAAAFVTAWLPTVKGTPVASSPLIAEPVAAGAPVLRPWTLTASTFGPAEAVSFLAACIGRESLAAGVFVGKDLAFAAAALQLAAGLVVRHQLVPSMEERAGAYRAVWRPV